MSRAELKLQLAGDGVTRATVPMTDMGRLVVELGGLLAVASNENNVEETSALYQLSGSRNVLIRATTAEATAHAVGAAMSGEPCSPDMQRALREVLVKARRIGTLKRFDSRDARFRPIVEPPEPIAREDFIQVRGVVVGVADKDNQDSITVRCDTGERVTFLCANGASFFRQRISVVVSVWRTLPGREESGVAIKVPVLLPPLTNDMDDVMGKIGQAILASGGAVDVGAMLADLRASRS